jgi:2-polyprenyl-3-methyl-5-hydroxy-6-metoxy-1,4-benzoquinol methylase
MTSNTTTDKHKKEIDAGERFAFGDNWTRFLTVLDEQSINQAVDSLKNMLEIENLNGKSFLDIGSGSGLFSLAARRLGARVFSFDYDSQSVACTRELKNRYFKNDTDWNIEFGSALDEEYMSSLGEFDIVYSWGVLHHTGSMWAALKNVQANVSINGVLFLALYNDQGGQSKRWLTIKKIYNKLPSYLNGFFAFFVFMPLEIRSFLIQLLRGDPLGYFDYIINYKKYRRGMSWWYDRIDWIGGFPFEVSKPEEIFSYYRNNGFTLCVLKTCAGGLGCNEYVFQRKCKLVLDSVK